MMRRSSEESSVRSVTQSIPYGVKKVYAVRKGYKPGVYFQWPVCEVQVKGFPGAVFKGFKSIREAEDWLEIGWRR
jgi:viroplasmin and RNaseH domain-containing protein